MEAGTWGACITKGARSWQIFQQVEGKHSIQLEGSWSCGCLEFELPLVFKQVEKGEVRVFARIVEEDTACPVLNWQECAVQPDGSWHTRLENVPAGGLYRIETRMEYERWDGFSITRGDMVHHVGVGDLYVIAGQSNAAGRAREPVHDPVCMGVHLLRESGIWDIATHPMAESTGAVFSGHYANHNPGHNPFLAFGRRIYERTGTPVGLIMAAYGGAPLRWWNPEENGALFREMLEVVESCTQKVRGILWYQGEGDGMEQTGHTYFSRFESFVRHVRQAFNDSELPFFTVQLGRYTPGQQKEGDLAWAQVRQAQREAGAAISNVFVVPAIDLPLFDAAHLSGAGNLVLGTRLACCALDRLYNQPCTWQAPEPCEAKAQPDGSLLLRFSHLENELYTYLLPPQELPICLQDESGKMNPLEYQKCGKDGLVIRFERDAKPGDKVHGAWQANPGGSLPRDMGGLPMLSFYGYEVT